MPARYAWTCWARGWPTDRADRIARIDGRMPGGDLLGDLVGGLYLERDSHGYALGFLEPMSVMAGIAADQRHQR